jgi:hypothetical protein
MKVVKNEITINPKNKLSKKLLLNLLINSCPKPNNDITAKIHNIKKLKVSIIIIENYPRCNFYFNLIKKNNLILKLIFI